jgi:molybdopterin synthase catalytic subunit
VDVKIRLFAGLRERAGADKIAVTLPDGARVADALAHLQGLTDGVPVVMAVNQEFADEAVVLHAGDELALIPPVSGGAATGADDATRAGVARVRISAQALSLDALVELVRDPRAGAVVTFTGVTREAPQLDYEAYAPMAERQLREIVLAAIERHGLCSAAAEHRIGTVPLSEPSVAVAVSAPHRAQAFDGAREIIDEIKARAAIWKREEGTWVEGAVPASEPRRAHGE